MFILYFIIGLFASTVGAIAGLGGGVIIKPVLDLLGQYSVSTIGVLSSATVFSMSVVSGIKAYFSGIRIKGLTSLYLAGSSIVGGFLGRNIFNYLIAMVKNDPLISFIQATMLAILMLTIYILVKRKGHMKQLNVTHIGVILLVGLILGLLSSFLGIGGGPLNVAILALLFSMNAKEAMINSILIIFFSQLSNLVSVGLMTGFGSYDLSMLWYMIAGGVIGGYVGTILAGKFSNKQIEGVFNTLLILILLVNIYNMIQFFI